jgi:membrane protease YdiL (CAAX protease family)
MPLTVDKKRLLIFLAFAFGIAWATGLVIALTGGIAGSPSLVPGSSYTLAIVLMATAYMGAPAIANVLTRLITREGWHNVGLRPNFRRGWPLWLAAWVLPAVFTIVGAAVYYLLFPASFDPELTSVKAILAQTGASGAAFTPVTLILFETLQAVLISPLINSLFTFGEEFGWRAYLLPKLMPLGSRRAVLFSGIIWGVWHWPVIAMGHNYGLDYPGYPWLGMLLMVLVCIGLGAFLSWVSLRGGSVWPAVIGHAAINGISALGTLALKPGAGSVLLGPLPVGIIGMSAWMLATALIYASRKALLPAEEEQLAVSN